MEKLPVSFHRRTAARLSDFRLLCRSALLPRCGALCNDDFASVPKNHHFSGPNTVANDLAVLLSSERIHA